MSWFCRKKKEPVVTKQEKKLEELLKSRQKDKNALSIDVRENVIDIFGKSVTEDDRQMWIIFLKGIEQKVLNKYKKVTVNFYVDLFNSSQGQYATKLLNILSIHNHRCQAIINWHYAGDDEFMLESGNFHKENYPQLEINLLEL